LQVEEVAEGDGEGSVVLDEVRDPGGLDAIGEVIEHVADAEGRDKDEVDSDDAVDNVLLPRDKALALDGKNERPADKEAAEDVEDGDRLVPESRAEDKEIKSRRAKRVGGVGQPGHHKISGVGDDDEDGGDPAQAIEDAGQSRLHGASTLLERSDMDL